MDPAGAVENARDTLGVNCRIAEGAFPTTPWTPQTAPTGSTGNLVLALEHDITSRISKNRCDNHGRELTEHRRYAPTSIPLRRNPCSRSRNRCSTSPEIPRHDGVDAPAGSRPRLPAAAQGTGRRLVRLSPPARDRTENRRLVEPVRGAGAEAERCPAHLLPLRPGHSHRGGTSSFGEAIARACKEAPRFRARVVGSTFSLKARRWSDALTMEFERKRQPPPPDTHAGVRLSARERWPRSGRARSRSRRRAAGRASSTWRWASRWRMFKGCAVCGGCRRTCRGR